MGGAGIDSQFVLCEVFMAWERPENTKENKCQFFTFSKLMKNCPTTKKCVLKCNKNSHLKKVFFSQN
jgi:hypothetical protein